jgi:hypothetical protein
VINQGFNVPIFNAKYTAAIDAFGEPIFNRGSATSVTTIVDSGSTALDLNLNTAPSIRYASMDYGYTGGRGGTSIVGNLASAVETKIGGGTYGSVYNPSQFLG